MKATAVEAETDGGVVAMDLGFPFWEARRRSFHPGDPFFASGNMERELLAKHAALELTSEERDQLHDMECMGGKVLFCPIVGCGSMLKSLEDFEDHYHTRHTASCSICSRVYPTSRLLSIHLSEVHDSFFQAKVARGYPMYECLVEGCRVKFNSCKSRQQHLVDKHRFPTSFEFHKKARPSKHQRQKYQRKKGSQRKVPSSSDAHMDMESSSDSKQEKGEENDQQCRQHGPDKENAKEMDVDAKVGDLASAVSRLSTSDRTPSSISFGHRHNRSFAFLPRSMQRNKKSSDVAGPKG